jgi:hypothetical protein
MIANKNTGASYVGSTSQQEPCTRWAAHLSQLQRNVHGSVRFQIAWNQSLLEDWVFYVLESNVEPAMRLVREQFWFEKENTILNGPNAITRAIRSDHLRERAQELLSAGKTYREISSTLGCSLGWITNFNRYQRK